MAVDKFPAGAGHPAVALMHRILAGDDQAWVHEHAGGDRRLVRQFRAQRRRSFYQCVNAVRVAALEAREQWAKAAERAHDYSGADWPLEYARLVGLLGMLIVTAEWRFQFGGGITDGLLQGLLARVESPAFLTSSTSAAI